MPFTNYQNIFASIDNHLIAYVTEKSRAVVVMLEPLVATGGGFFFLIQGYRHMTGAVEEPFMAFVHNVLKFGFILSTAFVAGNYNNLIVSTFQNSPIALASALSDVPLNGGGSATLSGSMGLVLDGITGQIQTIAHSFWEAGSALELQMYLIAIGVWLFGMVLTVLVGGLIVLSKITTAVMLALGPLYISFLLFDSTKNWFVSWIGALTQFGLVAALAVGVNALILSMFSDAATDIAARGGSAEIADLVALASTGGIGFMVLRQVTGLASTLAGGLTLSTFGAGTAARMAGKGAAGGAKLAGKGAKAGVQAAYKKIRGKSNSVEQTGEPAERRAPRPPRIRREKAVNE